MHVTNIYEAKTQLSKLIENALKGEEVIIGKAGKPIVRLIPYQETLPLRKPGLWEGKVTLMPDFDDLPADLQAFFNGE
jgi:prevent-host-death family protein